MRLNEFGNEKLSQYKTAAAADAKKADAAGDFARGHKRFKGINAATKKQFDNDAKLAKLKEQGVAEGALAGMKRLAGIAPVQTQTTPGQRQYRHMPTAVQPR